MCGFTVTYQCNGHFIAGITENGGLIGQQSPAAQVFNFSNGSSVTSTSGTTFSACYGLGFMIQSDGYVNIEAPSAGGVGLAATAGSTIVLGRGICLYNCYTAAQTSWGGTILFNNDFTVYSNGMQCLFASGGLIQLNPGITVSFPVYSNWANCFCWSYGGGVIGINGITWNGKSNVSGIRYKAEFTGIISTGGQGPYYLPGNQAGGTDLGGQYY